MNAFHFSAFLNNFEDLAYNFYHHNFGEILNFEILDEDQILNLIITIFKMITGG